MDELDSPPTWPDPPDSEGLLDARTRHQVTTDLARIRLYVGFLALVVAVGVVVQVVLAVVG